MTQRGFAGVLTPALTPFRADLSPDPARFARHCKWLLQQGCGGLAIFGTTSEANSLSVAEKSGLLDALVSSGVPAGLLMPGTGACSISDAVELTRQAVKLGCGGVLMLPPFYYKGVSDEGVYRYYAEVIRRVGDDRLRLYLYHIPAMSGVPISLELVARLLKDFPGVVAGLKDSAGDMTNTNALIERFAGQGFEVFPGSEAFLLEGLRKGGRGCITATGNVNPGAIVRLYQNWQGADAEKQQAEIIAARKMYDGLAIIPAMKAVMAHWSGDAEWKNVRPPLVELTEAQAGGLIGKLKSAGFAMADLR